MISELRINQNLSIKLDKLIAKIEEDEKKWYISHSDEHVKLLSIKENKRELNKIIDKYIDNYIKKYNNQIKKDTLVTDLLGEFNKSKMDEILKYYTNVIKSYHKEIEKLQNKRTQILDRLTYKSLKKYKSKNNETVIIFKPFLEQSIYEEYDIDIYISNNIFTEKEKEDFATIFFEYDLLISEQYYLLANYINDNKEIEKYQYLTNLKKDIKNSYGIHSGIYIKILSTWKIKTPKYNTLSLFKKELSLFKIYQNDTNKFEAIRQKFINDFFKKNKLWKYFYSTYILLETFYNKLEYNDFLSKKDIELMKNPDTNIIINKKSIIIKEKDRKNLELIKKWLLWMVHKLGVKNLDHNIYLYDMNYELDESNGKLEKIKVYD